uniref:arginine-hydroxylase NDUFAF5, mitochondrial-like n=1 Tax=Styela clava TaxID=7725 RepID=UPI00193A8751|nr:arginine-hydroxylase NDUFAF5, mitochondrial-like [Styela clava]
MSLMAACTISKFNKKMFAKIARTGFCVNSLATRHGNSNKHWHFMTSAAIHSEVNRVFDRKAKRIHKNFCNQSIDDIETYEYVKNDIAFQLGDRIADVSRDFPLALDLGCGRGFLSSHLTKQDTVRMIIQGDTSENCVKHAKESDIPISNLVLDEENLMFRESTFDIVMSNLSLHWVNDLPGCFKQVLKILKPDGCFLGAVLGGDTLYELRCSLQLAETEREGGMAAHVSPFLQGPDLTNLLSNAGFSLVTVDIDEMVIEYPSMFEVMDDIKGMGENNALTKIKPLHRDTITAASSIYQAMYGDEDNVHATYQILYFIGWKPPGHKTS